MGSEETVAMAEKGYNTNLASEFYVLATLHRLGLDAMLTLGNKKSVDIAVVRSAGNSVTIDVKGLAGKTGWPVDNVKDAKQDHFLVFVCYADKIGDVDFQPDVWVIPSTKLKPYIYDAPGGTRRVVPRSKLIQEAGVYRGAWSLIAGTDGRDAKVSVLPKAGFPVNEFGQPEIPSAELTVDMVPGPNAPYPSEVVDFALTFDGYRHFTKRVTAISDEAQQEFNSSGKLPRTLDRLRACLFWQQRYWRNDGGLPDDESMRFIRALLGAIRSKAAKRSLERNAS